MDNPHGPLTRRDFMQAMVAGSIAIAGLPAIAQADSTPGIFGGADAENLRVVVDALIPPAAGMPGAAAVGVPAFVERAAAAAPHIHDAVRTVLHAHRERQVLNEALDNESVLIEIERRHPEAFAMLVQTTYVGYYSAPSVLSVLGWADPALGQALVPFDPAELPETGR